MASVEGTKDTHAPFLAGRRRDIDVGVLQLPACAFVACYGFLVCSVRYAHRLLLNVVFLDHLPWFWRVALVLSIIGVDLVLRVLWYTGLVGWLVRVVALA